MGTNSHWTYSGWLHGGSCTVSSWQMRKLGPGGVLFWGELGSPGVYLSLLTPLLLPARLCLMGWEQSYSTDIYPSPDQFHRVLRWPLGPLGPREGTQWARWLGAHMY